MINLSAVIITYNEELNIGRCIDSVADIADEIVVVDSFSTDKTEEIVTEKGAKFIKHHFEDYVKQHVYADQQAKFDHIFSIDADEVVSPELKDSIIQVKENWERDGYTMNRLTNYCGKWIRHSGWYPDTKLRLYDRRKGKWEGIKIHECFVLSKGYAEGHLKGDLLHYSYHSVSQHIAQVNKFTDLTAHASFEKGKNTGTFKILVSPPVRFIRDYFLHLGILDGYHGFVICVISSHATFLKYVKLRQLHNQQQKT